MTFCSTRRKETDVNVPCFYRMKKVLFKYRIVFLPFPGKLYDKLADGDKFLLLFPVVFFEEHFCAKSDIMQVSWLGNQLVSFLLETFSRKK